MLIPAQIIKSTAHTNARYDADTNVAHNAACFRHIVMCYLTHLVDRDGVSGNLRRASWSFCFWSICPDVGLEEQ